MLRIPSIWVGSSRPAVALQVLLLPLLAAAEVTVQSTGDPAIDVPAVQAAVEQGGRVHLIGEFNFGKCPEPPGGCSENRVLLRKDVEITGDVDASGTPLTKIIGGEWTFFTPLPSPMPPTQAGPQVTIENLNFVSAKGAAIHLAYSGGCRISNNRITGMRPRVAGASTQDAIVVGPEHTRPRTNIEMTPLLVSGDIQLYDNYVDVTTPTPTSTRSIGVFISMYVGADVRVERNQVYGFSRNGINVLDGVADTAGRGSVIIGDNTLISQVVTGFTPPGPRAPNGIVVGFNNNRAPGTNPDLAMIPTIMTDNYVELYGRTSMGIINIFNGAIIKGNDIVVHADPAATVNRLSTSGGILATTSHQVVRNNRIVGEGCNAIRVGGTLDGQERKNNVVFGNNIGNFDAFLGGFTACADVWLEPKSHHNTFVGNSGTVIDNGIDNQITGYTSMAGGIGDDVSQAAYADAGWGFE